MRENKSTHMKFRVTEREKLDVVKAAKRKRVKVSALLRAVLEDVCRK